MWVNTAFLIMSSILAPGQSSPLPPYPDLSDPKAAAFSIAAALAKGDVKAARRAYAGEEKLFLEYLDALAETKDKSDRLQRAIVNRYGESWGTVIGSSFHADLEMKVGEKGDTKAPLTLVIAVAKVKRQGNNATLALTKDVEIRLKKTDAGWKVTNWPGPSPLGFVNLKLTERFLKELTEEVEQGKYKKIYEMTAAAQRIREKHTAELFEKLSPNEEGKKGDKK